MRNREFYAERSCHPFNQQSIISNLIAESVHVQGEIIPYINLTQQKL